MTTLNSYRGVDELLEKLRTVRVCHWLVDVAAGTLAVAAITLATALAIGVALGYWPDQPPALLRWSVGLAAVGVLAGALAWCWLRPALRRRNAAQTARLVESALPDVRNDLINSILLAGDDAQASRELVQQAIDEAVGHCSNVQLTRSVSLEPIRRWGLAAGILAAVTVAFVLLQPGRLSRGVLAAVSPTEYVPRVNSIELESLTPGDVTVFAGETLAISAMLVEPLDNEVGPARVLIEGRDEPIPMLASDGGRRLAIPPFAPEEGLRYAVQIGEDRWPIDKPWHEVTVIRRIEVKGLDLTLDYPEYTGWPDKPIPNARGDIDVPIGTKVTIALRLAESAPRVTLERSGAAPAAMKASGSTYRHTFGVMEDGRYRIVLSDRTGRPIQQVPALDGQAAEDIAARIGEGLDGGSFRIHAASDESPTVAITRPGKDVSVAPGGTLTIRLKATDVIGLSGVAVYGGREGRHPAKLTAFPNTEINGRKKVLLDYEIALGDAAEGDVLIYHATATDNRQLSGVGGFQTSESSRYRILVQDAAKVEAQRTLLRDRLRRQLIALLEAQLKQRVASGVALRKLAKIEPLRTAGANLRVAQGRIRQDMLEIVTTFPFDETTVPVQQALALLAKNEARQAVAQADALATLAKLSERNETCMTLIDSQEHIIDSLKALLVYMPQLAKKPHAGKDTPGGDLPADAWEKYRKLKEGLKEFAEEQKKVVAATERLVKTPVDNFQEDKKLKELQATQDKWEKFINEKFADFSKLAEQDFANPSVLKELISVKCDVTMAKDALAEKAKEIATAAEESGVENAKSLTANIEKWLPDKPDRIKWAMEAPAGGQDNVEMPELPTEMEDLVGDLLEQEEDLFDEMDDVTSKATMSGDKGIGWDAMDGPISNMNAQGVTGNQLPNTNELQGRSGEGRQGKSSGEFVEDKAVGKGGRRTPTRLTPEPFQKGQVDDKSKDPPGGATGGGKISGAGEQGLEGPVPPDVKKQMQRLAGKQAALLNKAERIEAKFRTSDYSAFQLKQAIVLMNRVQKDLEAGRYRNALRRRRATLSALEQSKLMLSGDIDVTADTAKAMPKYVRDDIADAMKGTLPREYEDVLRQYYQRLREKNR